MMTIPLNVVLSSIPVNVFLLFALAGNYSREESTGIVDVAYVTVVSVFSVSEIIHALAYFDGYSWSLNAPGVAAYGVSLILFLWTHHFSLATQILHAVSTTFAFNRFMGNSWARFASASRKK